MPSKYEILIESADHDGWSQWIIPENQFRLMCCTPTCKRVHDFEFAIVKIHSVDENGNYEGFDVENEKLRIMFRAKTNSRATAAAKRKKVKK